VISLGAVIAIGPIVIGSGKREKGNDGDHAEKAALKSVHEKSQSSMATIQTTLEPCTADARSQASNACTERTLNPDQLGAELYFCYVQFFGVRSPGNGRRCERREFAAKRISGRALVGLKAEKDRRSSFHEVHLSRPRGYQEKANSRQGRP
jgi:hypothetical protein